MKPLLNSNLPQGPVYVFSKLNEIPTLLLTKNIVRDTVVFVIDVRPPLTKLKINKVSKFAEAYITDKTIFLRCSVLTIWEEHISENNMLTEGFTKQFVMIDSGLKPNELKGRYGFQTCPFLLRGLFMNHRMNLRHKH